MPKDGLTPAAVALTEEDPVITAKMIHEGAALHTMEYPMLGEARAWEFYKQHRWGWVSNTYSTCGMSEGKGERNNVRS